MIRGTVCVSACTYGSVGALGGQPPRATLPMLWLTLVVAAFFAGFQFHKSIAWKRTVEYLNEHDIDVAAWNHAANEYGRLRAEHERQKRSSPSGTQE